MMDSTYVEESNKIASSGAWIWLMEIYTAGATPNPTLRYTNNNAKPKATEHYYTTWPVAGGGLPPVEGEQYWSVPFALDDVAMSIDGAFPEYKLVIGDLDVDGALRTRIREYDGLVGSTVRLMVVHSAHLDLTTPAIDELAEILSCEVTAQAVVFTIGIPSLLSCRFPRDRYLPGFCRHKFGGALCKYTQPTDTLGSLTSDRVSFIVGDVDAGYDYDIVWVDDGGLLNLFDQVPGKRVCRGNLISNGDFEDGGYTAKEGWDYGGYADDWLLWDYYTPVERRWSTDKGRVKYGTHSYYHISSSIYSSGIAKELLVSGLKWHAISCWVYVEYTAGEDNGGIRMQVDYGSEGYDKKRQTAYANNIGWQRLTLVFQPVANRPTRFIIGLGGSGTAYFDGVCMVEGSTPADFDHINLVRDVGFTVTGSNSNDGALIAYNDHDVADKYVRVHKTRNDWDSPLVNEDAGASVTLQLGYTGCDHTLEACQLRNNSQNYGGSPGVAGGVYG